MSNLLSHAERELSLIGYDGKDEYNNMVKAAIIELLTTFTNQGHSGFSASYVINTFAKLAKYQILSPLTGDDDEWNNVGDGYYQNNRDSSVFKTESGCYCVDGIVWVDDTGSYTNYKSKLTIKSFPFTPKTFYVKVDKDGNAINLDELTEAYSYYNGVV